MLLTVVAAELESHGYKPRSIERFDLPVFVKPLPSGLYAILEFTQIHVLNPSRFVIDVGLYRRRATIPMKISSPLSWLHLQPADQPAAL